MTSSSFFRWFFGLDVIPEGADGIQLTWQYPPAVWGWFLMFVGTIIIVVWSYRRMVGSRFTRFTLATIRGILFVFVSALIAGPLLQLPITENQPDWVAVLVDRSRSMSVSDSSREDGSIESRDGVIRQILQNNVWSDIQKEREIVWLGFHASAFNLDPKQLQEPDGWSTDLTVPIETALRKLAGRPASGVVIISDGRTTRPIDRGVLRALQARAVPVFVVPLGSADATTDLAVTEAEAPSRAFIRDQVPVVAKLQCVGGAPRTSIQVDLIDEKTGKVIHTVEVTPEEFVNQRAEAVLTGVQSEAGPTRWVVRVRASSEDLVRANDEQAVEVDFIDRPLRVLYIEGYPRWEFRYLKNLLVRESSFESSVMLLSADRDFAQEGNAPLERLPQTEDEFMNYDLFILGDVPSGSLSGTQITQIKQAVSERGAGLLWIGGERSTPNSWKGTDLEDLLPMHGVPERFDEAIYVEPTENALRAGVMRLGESAKERWPATLSPSGERGQLEWAQRIEKSSLKPTTEVLAQGRTLSGKSSSPIVLSMRYGAGLVVYVATDETWRWRHGIGETYQERFWIQFIRYLSRGTTQSDGNSFRLVVEPKQPEVGTPAIIRVEIQDPKAANTAGDGPLDIQIQPIETTGTPTEQAIQITRETSGWVGLWTPENPGLWRVRVESSRINNMEQVVKVIQNDTELSHPETDHPQLIDLATRTNGSVIAPVEIEKLRQLLPKRAASRERSILDPIWNSPAALFLVLLLLLLEWIGRRVLRLA